MDKIIKAVNAFSYLSMTLESTGWWGKHKEGLRVKGNQALVAIHKCLTRTLNMIRLVQSVYKMISG
jgi:hypothetical protein